VSGFSAELAAELDGRLSDLVALVQELSVVKGDQAGLQELRVLLADTATQVGGATLRCGGSLLTPAVLSKQQSM
jgi:hypothetical protein